MITAAPSGRPVGPRPWSLRARLLAGQLLLLVTVVIGIGVATELALHQFLVDQLDGQLAGAQNRAQMAVSGPPPFFGPPPSDADPGPQSAGPGSVAPPSGPGPHGTHVTHPGPHATPLGPGAQPPALAQSPSTARTSTATPQHTGAQPPTAAHTPVSAPAATTSGPPQASETATPTSSPGPEFLSRPGVPPDEIGAIIEGRTITAVGKLGSDGNRTALSDTAERQLAAVSADGRSRTMSLDGLGRYRVVAEPGPDDGQTVLTGLSMAPVDATLLRVLMVLGIVAAIVLLIAITVGITLIRRALAPLDRVAATAYRVADLPLDHGEVELPVRVPADDADPRTEVGRLGAAVNRMLDNITGALSARYASETRVRRFVADASHELRTPLAAIRGYTELAQRNSNEVPPAVADAMSRVDAAAIRMSGLVEDLLLLARLDSGRPLEHEPVDLTRITADAVTDAHIAGADHQWEMNLPDEPVEITGDAARLHQVLANLLTNARVHTGPGTVVTTSLESDGAGGVRWRVRDTGPGIPAELVPEIFQRFARGDSSRSRHTGSTGLGLAIASAVVRAHGGDITVTSEPGDTAFTVHLPKAGSPPESS
ncbi:sensor histidine kinase [Nocardia jiangxiensis]|uniref:histidine kinase n=1 Tax=Nocardia jiangxiensis TaxID=282685 RepID=A0ABW6S0W7_9NOCA|nr:HAMP domain-containing sensor histidine kinase [Nocardia jiangxiensis]